ncbi:hypothetical protein H5395_16785 [Paracoccus sp. MC1854]|uniref:hypothetical protein n=1 Tax=Paracoccus sp. MC1854 TaxID=2760306 RepID=UPI0016033DB4|nr:hypothetical protein [Paracoccus sp. MC1854]MBB1493130.1 hypothetical protein [Paracoccus sp. MC1854]
MRDIIVSNVPPDTTDHWWEIAESTSINDVYIDAAGELSIRRPRPAAWAEFDYVTETWFDPRTEAELAEELHRVRAATQLDKSDLLIRLAVAGILSPEEAEEAAGGTIPASMQPMLQMLPPEAQMAARIKWRSDNLISRNHPVIVAAAYALGVTDQQLDTIFGVSP